MLHKLIRALVLEGEQAARDRIFDGIGVHRGKRYIEADVFETGSEAIRALEKEVYDIAFVDMEARSKRGLDVIASIKQTKSEKCLAVPLAASQSPGLMAVLREVGAYHVLQKPLPNGDAVADLIFNYMTMTMATPLLIVGSSPAMRKSVRGIFEDSQFRFEFGEADSAENAIRMLASGHYKLAVTDFDLPVRDGLELAGAIRNMSNKIGILMMSGDSSSFLERSAAFVGVAGFLNVPFVAEDIDAVMHDYFNLTKPSFGKKRDMFNFISKEKKVS